MNTSGENFPPDEDREVAALVTDAGDRPGSARSPESVTHQNPLPRERIGTVERKSVAYVRFGLKSLAVLTVIAAVIFALINFAGALYGLLISFAVGAIGLMIVFFGGLVAYRRVDHDGRQLINTWLLTCCLLCAGLFLAVCFAGGGKGAAYFLNELAIKKKFSTELGFTYDSERHFVADELVTTIRITSVSPGGEFEGAGFLVDDIVYDMDQPKFFNELANHSGEEMTVNVVAGGTSYQANQLDKLPRRAVTFNVP